MILHDRQVTNREIEITLGVSGTSIHLTFDYQKYVNRREKTRVHDWSKEKLHSKRVDDIVTGEASWIYASDPDSKQQSTL